MKNVRYPLYCALILLLLATGCRESEEATAANTAATDWLNAVITQDGPTIEALNCQDVAQTPGSEQVITLWAIGLSARRGGIDVETLSPDFTVSTVQHEDMVAQVRVTGTIRISAEIRENEVYLTLPPEETVEVDDRWQMVREADGWKWCGSV